MHIQDLASSDGLGTELVVRPLSWPVENHFGVCRVDSDPLIETILCTLQATDSPGLEDHSMMENRTRTPLIG